MKFQNVLFFATAALAAPTELVSRQSTVVGTISNAVNTLQGGIGGNVNAVNKAVADIKASTDANLVVQLQGTVKTNLQAIADALTTAGASVTAVTTGAAGGIAAGVKDLTQASIDQLAKDLKTTQDAIKAIEATLQVTATDLTPDARDFIASEVAAVKSAIAPFVTPLTTFANAAKAASATAKLTVTGLGNALRSLVGILLGLNNSIGLPIGGLPSVSNAAGSAGVPGVGLVL